MERGPFIARGRGSRTLESQTGKPAEEVTDNRRLPLTPSLRLLTRELNRTSIRGVTDGQRLTSALSGSAGRPVSRSRCAADHPPPTMVLPCLVVGEGGKCLSAAPAHEYASSGSPPLKQAVIMGAHLPVDLTWRVSQTAPAPRDSQHGEGHAGSLPFRRPGESSARPNGVE
ncbi:hypothetical protein AAFF_G00161900 [Aldrovandia affinis]|uniref:Uncharacterized protein n=1 Tax=Aldrovandia affinis TaxID=143900 RepID=A0AAD7W882_9TELE|nr:hypothetical protein AAFF_G00161900 [Aldrovandia affinis]